MSLSGIASILTGSSGSTGSTDILHRQATAASDASLDTTAVLESAASTYQASSSDLLALASNATYTNLALLTAAQQGNTYDPEAGTSRYLTAKLESFQLADQMEAAKQSDMVTTLAQFGGITVGVVYEGGQSGTAADAVASAAAIKQAYKNERDTRVIKDAAATFKQDRAEAEQQAEEAQAPKDADGNPIVVDGQASDTPRPKDAEGNPVAQGQNSVEAVIQAGDGVATESAPGQDGGAAGEAGQSGDAIATAGEEPSQPDGRGTAGTTVDSGGSAVTQARTLGDASLAMVANQAGRYTAALEALAGGDAGTPSLSRSGLDKTV